MIRALYTAASGMMAQETNLDNVANNLANSSTTGFRRRRIQFEDLIYQTLVMPGAAASQQTTMVAGLQVGLGTRTAASEVIQLQGDFLRAAVVGLGFQRVSDIAMSCGVLNMMPRDSGIDPIAFWEHSLGCALVARHFARKISYPDPGKAYLAGLLHDLGIIVNLWVLPKEFIAAFDLARKEGIPLHEAEQTVLGFTHCDSGRLLAERWELAADLKEVVSLHHDPKTAHQDPGLVALVEMSDLLCRMSGLNYGYTENRQINLMEQTGFEVLSKQCQGMKDLDWARLTFELDSYLDDVHALVRSIYRT